MGSKFYTLIRTIENWPLVILDKLGLRPLCTYRTRSGHTFYCRSRSTDIHEVVVVWSGTEYPPEHLKLAEGSVVFDIGANVGSFAIYVSHLNPHISFSGYAFEPYHQNFALLNRNLSANGVSSFRALSVAISDRDTEVWLDVNRPVDAVAISEDKAGQRVMSHKLSTFCRAHNIPVIDLLKLDVEGSEYPIFETDYDFLARSVRKIIMEYHVMPGKYNKTWLLDKVKGSFEVAILTERENCGTLVLTNKKLS